MSFMMFYFFGDVSLHVLKIHLTADSLTTECMMWLRLWSLNQSRELKLNSLWPVQSLFLTSLVLHLYSFLQNFPQS